MKREVYAMLSAAVLACGVAHAQPQAAASGAAPGQAVKPGQVVPVAGGAPATASVVPAPMAPALSAEEAAYLNEEAALVRKLRLTQLQAQLAEQERKLRGEEAEKPDSASLLPIPSPSALATGPMQQQLPSPMAEAAACAGVAAVPPGRDLGCRRCTASRRGEPGHARHGARGRRAAGRLEGRAHRAHGHAHPARKVVAPADAGGLIPWPCGSPPSEGVNSRGG